MFTPPPPYQPVTPDATGVLRVAGTRVTLDTVIHAYQDGAPPEEIVERYDSVPLAAAYATIGYYLQHQAELDAYLHAREQEAERSARW